MGRPRKELKEANIEISAPRLTEERLEQIKNEFNDHQEAEPVYDQETLALVKNPTTHRFYIQEVLFNSNGDVKMGKKVSEEDFQSIIQERMRIMLVQKGIV